MMMVVVVVVVFNLRRVHEGEMQVDKLELCLANNPQVRTYVPLSLGTCKCRSSVVAQLTP